MSFAAWMRPIRPAPIPSARWMRCGGYQYRSSVVRVAERSLELAGAEMPKVGVSANNTMNVIIQVLTAKQGRDVTAAWTLKTQVSARRLEIL